MGWWRRLSCGCSWQCWGGGSWKHSRKRGGGVKLQKNNGRKMILCQLFTQFSSCLGHEIHPYL
jgi:hypothetical protein